jgi:hypothetical protein
MLGRHRQHATARVIARQRHQGNVFTQEGIVKYDYVVDVTPEDGNAPFRATFRTAFATDEFMLAPAVGDDVPVTFREGGKHVEFDMGVLKQRDKDARSAARDEFARTAAAPPGTPPPAPSGPAFAAEAAEFRRDADALGERSDGLVDTLAALLKAKQSGDQAEVERLKAEIAAQQTEPPAAG